jgi:hypothetical protein
MLEHTAAFDTAAKEIRPTASGIDRPQAEKGYASASTFPNEYP